MPSNEPTQTPPFRHTTPGGYLRKPDRQGVTLCDSRMIRRIYVHNFRCLENFELSLGGLSSALLIGQNGAGKTTVAVALEVLQRIARGTNRVGDLVRPKDLTRGRRDVPMRFEIEVELATKIYRYAVAFEYPDRFRELRVCEEKLIVDGDPVFTRELAQVPACKSWARPEANFKIDWHLVALPIVQSQAATDPISTFKQWLANTLILRPIPSLMRGDFGIGGAAAEYSCYQYRRMVFWFACD